MAAKPSLRSLIIISGTLLIVVPAVIAGSFYTRALQRETEKVLVDKLVTRGELGADQLARRLHELWQEVTTLADTVDPDDLARARQQLDTIAALGQRYSWIGVTDTQGKVLISTNGLLEGADVGQRPWFRRGLAGPAAVDVHEAQLLAKLLPAQPEPYRFIDLAAPWRPRGQAPQGVVGAHVDWKWVQSQLSSLQAPGIDVILLSADRKVLFGPQELLDKQLQLGSALAAGKTTRTVLDERWPDGRDYVTVTIPTVGFADLPGFGWTLLVRQDIVSALGPTQELIRSFWITTTWRMLAAVLVVIAAAWWITTPMRRIAASAEAMATGADATAPHSESRYQEAARISSALMRLHSQAPTPEPVRSV